MKDFAKWFIRDGFKSYAVAYIIIIALGVGIGMGWQDVLMSPVPVQLTLLIAYLGFSIGVTIHMYQTYKKNK